MAHCSEGRADGKWVLGWNWAAPLEFVQGEDDKVSPYLQIGYGLYAEDSACIFLSAVQEGSLRG